MGRHRTLYALLGLAFAAVVVGTVLLAPSGREDPLPTVVESISPDRDETVLRQAPLVIDIRAEYRLDLFVDGLPIPEDQIDYTESVGRYVWQPQTETGEWTPGAHSVRIVWDTRAGLPDQGELRWTFRVQ